MKHRNHPKRIAHFKKKYKHLAAAFAGVMILSSALLPGIPTSTAYAATKANVGNSRATTTKIASANRAGSAAGQNTIANETAGAASLPNLSGNETSNPTNSNAAPETSPREKTPATPKSPKVSGENTPKNPEPPKESEDKTPPVPEPPKESEDKTPPVPEPPKESEDKTPPVPEPPKVNEDKTPTIPALPIEGGSQINLAAPSFNPNQDTVNTPEPPTIPALPIEGGSQISPAEPSANPNQDTVNTPLPLVRGNQAKANSDSPKNTGDVPTEYKEVLNVTATAYSPGPLDNDQWGDKTYMGTTIRPGVIAVDPRVIPLGSRVYIQYPDGRGEYAVAEDTGGAIKGNRIDIALMDRGDAKDFGIQPVKVYVVDTPKKT